MENGAVIDYTAKLDEIAQLLSTLNEKTVLLSTYIEYIAGIAVFFAVVALIYFTVKFFKIFF